MRILTPRICKVDGVIHHLVPDGAAIPRVNAVVRSTCEIPFPTVLAVVFPQDAAWNSAFERTRTYFVEKAAVAQVPVLMSVILIFVRVLKGSVVVLSCDDVYGGKVATGLRV